MHPDSAKSEIAVAGRSHLEIFMFKPCSEHGSVKAMAISSMMNSAHKLFPAVFLLICSSAYLRAADDSFRPPDSLVLKDGTVVHGLIIKNTRDSVLIQQKFGEVNYPKSRIVRINDNADTNALYTDINPKGKLPYFR